MHLVTTEAFGEDVKQAGEPSGLRKGVLVRQVGGDTEQALATLGMVTDELVKQFGRDTVIGSADSNNRAYARVPTGSDTCAFCIMLASRGFVYSAAKSAGELSKFHGDCDCAIVA